MTGDPRRATVTDVHIRFVSLVALLVKLAFASIPAAFIVTAVWIFVARLVTFLFRTFGPQLGSPFTMP